MSYLPTPNVYTWEQPSVCPRCGSSEVEDLGFVHKEPIVLSMGKLCNLKYVIVIRRFRCRKCNFVFAKVYETSENPVTGITFEYRIYPDGKSYNVVWPCIRLRQLPEIKFVQEKLDKIVEEIRKKNRELRKMKKKRS